MRAPIGEYGRLEPISDYGPLGRTPARQEWSRAAFDVLTGLLASGEGDFEHYDLIENTPAVLAAVLDLDDPDLTARAEALLTPHTWSACEPGRGAA